MTTIRRAQESQAPLLPVAPLASRSVATRPTVTTTQVPGQGDSFVRSQQAPVNLAGNQAPQQAIPVSNHVILSSPNQERAASTSASLAAMARQSPQAGQRLTPDIRGALELGVSNPRTGTRNGQEGILGQRQAEEAARALVAMPQAQYDQLKSLLSRAGLGPNGQPAPGADGMAEQALILKAVAARSSALSSSTPGNPEPALTMEEIQNFANEVRGMDRTLLIRTTSVLDLEEDVNTSNVDPDRPRSAQDQRTDNDGLYQRFHDSCVPTGSQIVRAEADPIYARALHRAGIDDPSINAPITQEQAMVLEKERFATRGHIEVQLTPEQLADYQLTGTLPAHLYATSGSAVSRLGTEVRAELDRLLREAGRPNQPTAAQATAIRQYMNGGLLTAEQQGQLNAGLAVLRNSHGGFPTQEQLYAVLTNSARPSGRGMLYHHALNELASPVTNMQYSAVNGATPARLQEVAKRLESGQDVPITVHKPGGSGSHAMVFTDVRDSSSGRSFQLADPWSGRNAWISEQDLLNPNSDYLQREFGISWTKIYSIYM